MSTFTLKADAKSNQFRADRYQDFTSYLYTRHPVIDNQGKIVVRTEPRSGHVIAPSFGNGFVGAIFQAYNEHRHLVLRPDDVWLAITTAFGLYVNKHAEEMRASFVDHEGKIELTATGGGNLYSADWPMMIDQMSGLIEENTKGDVRQWIEPNFTTTTPTIKAVGQVVLMGVMKEYFDFKMCLMCGLPKVTLEGTIEDWREVRRKASHLKTFNQPSLTHWADLLDPVLAQLEQSYLGKADVDFWSRICHVDGWGSGPRYLCGWVNVFIPFSTSGEYKLKNANPSGHDWTKIDMNDVPPSTVEVPVMIDDNGREYSTIFYGGHVVCVYNEADDSLAPSLDWAIVDVTEFLEAQSKGTAEGPEPKDELKRLHSRRRPEDFPWQSFPKPAIYSQGA